MSPDPGAANNEKQLSISFWGCQNMAGYLDVNEETIIGALNMRRISYWETGLVVCDVRKNAIRIVRQIALHAWSGRFYDRPSH